LRFARFDGEQWNIQTIDGRGSVGLYCSLVFDKDDQPVISYFHKSKGDLRVARFDGTAWTISTVDYEGVIGRSTSIALNERTGEIAVAYENSTLGRLKVAREAGAGAGWSHSEVDLNTQGVAHVSVAFDSHDQPAVSYYDIFAGDLKYATFNGAVWNPLRLASKGTVGLYTQLNFDALGDAHIVYYSRRNDLVAHLFQTDGVWDANILQLGGGRYIAATQRPEDLAITYTWFEPGPAKLHLAEV
jgi:hypothetical protein